MTFTVVAVNRGNGSAKETVIAVPFNPAAVAVEAISFSRDAMRTSAILSDSVQIATGPLYSNNDTVTATLKLRVLPNAPDGEVVGGRVIFGSGVQTINDHAGNLINLMVGTNDNSLPYAAFTVSPVSGPAGSTHTFSSSLFAPGEPVTFWYNTPTGAAVALKSIAAGSDGVLNVTFITTQLDKGAYSLVGRGNWTGLTVVGVFEVQ